jgi:glycosyltransferase involved in cell wall biosynthesis
LRQGAGHERPPGQPTLRIAFVMPEASPRPVGGAKTVYRYADELAARGHYVALVHPQESLLASVRARLDRDPEIQPLNSGSGSGDADAAGTEAGRQPHPWYKSRPDVLDLLLPRLEERWISSHYDFVIATNQQVVAPIQGYSPRMGRKLYFLLDYESYLLGDREERRRTRQTLKIDWPIMVRSPAVRRLVESVAGRPCYLVPGAIDTDTFQVTIPVESAERTLVGFPARTERTKRTFDAVRALELARAQLPSPIRGWCFGYEQIDNLPPWITQHLAPDDQGLRELYNRSRIFLVPSQWEGFGQPGAEAMACGAALISTRNGGVEMYAEDRRSAILCPPCDPQAMAAAIVQLIRDDRLRQAIAHQGTLSLRGASWREAAIAFERLLMAEVADR